MLPETKTGVPGALPIARDARQHVAIALSSLLAIIGYFYGTTVLVALANVATLATLLWMGARSLRRAELAPPEVRESLCVARDITARKRIEAALQHIAAVVASSHDAILSKKLDGTILSWNPAAEALYGYTAEEIIGTSVLRLLPPEGAAEEAQIIARIKAGESIDQYESVRVRKDGSLVDVSLTISAVKDATGQIIGASKIARDITARKHEKDELRRAKEAAEAANRAKSEFLANMSHEIRTPMNGILGMTDLVLDTPLNDEQREYLGMAKSSAHALLCLINDILDFSKIEAGKLELEAISFPLRHSLATMLKPLRVRAGQKNLELAAEILDDVPEHVIGDPLRLRQVLINLIDNAIKFTDCGSVRLRVAVVPELIQSPQTMLSFSVTDSGIGIAEEKQALIFDAFAQADGTMTRTHGGTGLGLAIASQLVQQMGGQLWLDSATGKGTTFHFTASLGIDRAPVLPSSTELAENGSVAASESGPAGLRILLADDNLINRALAAGLLEKRGHFLTQAVNGREAVEAATAADFDLVLMDVQMPEMDGLEATRRIRGLEIGTGRHTPIAALTAHALTGDRERCLTAGMDDYLIKPLQKNALLPLLERISSDRQASEAPRATAPLTPPVEAAPIFSRAHLLDELDDDESLLQRMVALFHENTPHLLDKIRSAIERSHAPDLAGSAHALLSSLGAFGAQEARRLTRQLETLGQQGKLTRAGPLFAELEREAQRVFAALAQLAAPEVA